MRICFLSRRYFPAISGMSVYAKNYLNELVKLGHDVVMISQYRNDVVGTKIYGGGPPPAVTGVEVVGLEALGEQRVNAGQRADFEADIQVMVKTALEHHRIKPFDLVHAQYGYPNGLAALEISRQTNVPNVVSIQGGDGHWVGLCCQTHAQAIRAVLDHANELIIGSLSFAEEVQKHHGTVRSRFTIIPGAINTDDFNPRRDRALGEVRTVPVLLYHGRVDRRKGVLELIEAMEKLKGKGQACRLIISGIGPDLEAAKEQARQQNLDDRIEFSGYVSHERAAEVYRTADIFVSPTWSEGFSNTILEAMACGLPIVAARAIGVVDCLRENENALFHEVHDVNGIVEKVTAMLEHATLRSRLAETALAEIQTKYQWSVIVQQIVQRLETVLLKKPDNRWTEKYDPTTTAQDADASCRFRESPHLL